MTYARGTAIDLRLLPGACGHCSSEFTAVQHGGPCPRVAEIEYHPNGAVKRVVYRPDGYDLRSPYDRSGR